MSKIHRDLLSGQAVYKENQFVLYQYGNDLFKLIRFKVPCRQIGFECEDSCKTIKGSVNDTKTYSNIRRAKEKVFEYAYCNEWTHFATFTIDNNKFPRDDLAKYYKVFSQWLRDKRKTIGEVKYLIIPELHSDLKNWHMHALMYFENPDLILKPFAIDDSLSWSTVLKFKDLNQQGYLNWQEYADKFGFCSFGAIKDKIAVSYYVTKYISKSIECSADKIGLNNKLYYNSRGLSEKVILKKGNMSANISALIPDFENDYVMINTFSKVNHHCLDILLQA